MIKVVLEIQSRKKSILKFSSVDTEASFACEIPFFDFGKGEWKLFCKNRFTQFRVFISPVAKFIELETGKFIRRLVIFFRQQCWVWFTLRPILNYSDSTCLRDVGSWSRREYICYFYIFMLISTLFMFLAALGTSIRETSTKGSSVYVSVFEHVVSGIRRRGRCQIGTVRIQHWVLID